jgi:transposase
MIRMPIVGYCMGIRSERRLCDEVHLNLAYRWFCAGMSPTVDLTARCRPLPRRSSLANNGLNFHTYRLIAS